MTIVQALIRLFAYTFYYLSFCILIHYTYLVCRLYSQVLQWHEQSFKPALHLSMLVVIELEVKSWIGSTVTVLTTRGF
jgi:hypothetical protein